ncbi:formate--tetrahydrofolate ligase [Fructilactobacillus florum]|uniref:Formate--tetrahydrofolate ligase n=1 Tax=Fructilactobacillus florum DSM 22689 = JCM 16035 TaxID=1423745 RepID=A0A0R2CKI5_9LACO|nr:formate--tetrahydrofolate ligase [Fructilactobacillus florum]KRM91744.1 formate--tetrahydrofolate ligase [Fructilactobacillus florum DSM 22689 = JCM 16035]
MKTDAEISQEARLEPISKIAAKLNIPSSAQSAYGNQIAKISNQVPDQETKQKLVLVTATNPTKAGEGKSTVLIGLGDALTKLGQRTAIAIREPSMGPVFGMKGGAAGGGYSQIEPMIEINLNFTGDLHAITEAHNTLAALIDNSIFHGNPLNLDPDNIVWNRVEDVNDRGLRRIQLQRGKLREQQPANSSFSITAASEIMAILCLAANLADLKHRLGQILIGYNQKHEPVLVSDLGVQDALTIILKDALQPNLVQTLAGTPAIVHGGPFANIAMGCNSILATKLGLKTADYTLTEAGFGADLGGQKFMDLVTPQLQKTPDAVVVVASVRSLKLNGNQAESTLDQENMPALRQGVANLDRHVQAMEAYGKPVIVAINQFSSDTDAELALLEQHLQKRHVPHALTTTFQNGGAGALELGKLVQKACDQTADFHRTYKPQDSLELKLTKIAQRSYGARKVTFSESAHSQLIDIKQRGWDKLPVCISKTQYSLTDDPQKMGAPTGFEIHITKLEPKLGAGFIVAQAGKIITMPGLPTMPAASNMKITDQGEISGLF